MTYRPSYTERVERLLGSDQNVNLWVRNNRNDKFYLQSQVWQIREEMIDQGLAFHTTDLDSIASALFYVLGWDDWKERSEEVREMEQAKRRRTEEKRQHRREEVKSQEMEQVPMIEVEPVRGHRDDG